jgi:hydrogenase small subunit
MIDTFYGLMRRQGITRRSFLKYCSLTAASLGFGPAYAQQIARALETKPRMPVVWLHGLECTCCTESFIRSAHPLAKDVILSMISLDFDDTIMAAAGDQAIAALEDTITKYKGNYILAVEGNPPLNEDGMFCMPRGKPFVEDALEVTDVRGRRVCIRRVIVIHATTEEVRRRHLLRVANDDGIATTRDRPDGIPDGDL